MILRILLAEATPYLRVALGFIMSVMSCHVHECVMSRPWMCHAIYECVMTSCFSATICNNQQHSATQCTWHMDVSWHHASLQHNATLQQSATIGNTLQHSATQCIWLGTWMCHDIMPLCNTMRHPATHCTWHINVSWHRVSLQQSSTQYNNLQHNATHCTWHMNVSWRHVCLQQSATHCNTLYVVHECVMTACNLWACHAIMLLRNNLQLNAHGNISQTKRHFS